MTRFLTAIILIILLFVACSRSSSPVDTGTGNVPFFSSGQLPTSDIGKSGDIEIWGSVDIILNSDSGTIVTAERSLDLAARHFKVTNFLSPPFCSNCIKLLVVESDLALGTVEASVSITNPTMLSGYDVRGMVRIPSTSPVRFLNPDAHTSLFSLPGYRNPVPYRVFARSQQNHEFKPGATNTEFFQFQCTPFSGLHVLSLVVTAGYPSAPGDVSIIKNFRQTGTLFNAGGSAGLNIDVTDLQNDISGVVIYGNPIGAPDIWMIPSNGHWQASLTNNSGNPGIHELKIDAFSPNAQNAVTSQVYKAVVFHNVGNFRSELLALVNSDRASDGKLPLVLDDLLCTAAQFHGQDMADKNFFAHVNLDNWTPWDRMHYYGVMYNSAGENIAVGQDSPSQVETDWMNSSGHRANILNDSFGKIGLGIVPIPAGNQYYPGYYWVQAFTN